MGKKHLKRKPAPKFWPIHRKESIWTAKPKPGPHPVSSCLPLLLIVREVLGLARTRKEAKIIISKEKIKVDGKTRREELFSVGLMDVISIPEVERRYRILPSEKGLILHPIGEEEEGFKLCRIENKILVEGGHTQLNLHDGRNVLIQVKDPRKPEEDTYETFDSLKLNIPAQEVVGHMKLTDGASAIVIGGKNLGRHGKIVAIEKKRGQKRKNSLVTIEDARGKRFQAIMDFTFVVGDTQPWMSLPEVK